jgi:acetyl-CoA decarbonylase/synthase complex subunit gamma
MGALFAAILAACSWHGWIRSAGGLEILAWLLLIPAISAYLAMNFTGASTYTSLSGVKKEMRWALPLEIAGGIIGVGLWFGSQFIA